MITIETADRSTHAEQKLRESLDLCEELALIIASGGDDDAEFHLLANWDRAVFYHLELEDSQRIDAAREFEPCIMCGAPIDPVTGLGHDEGCSYDN